MCSITISSGSRDLAHWTMSLTCLYVSGWDAKWWVLVWQVSFHHHQIIVQSDFVSYSSSPVDVNSKAQVSSSLSLQLFQCTIVDASRVVHFFSPLLLIIRLFRLAVHFLVTKYFFFSSLSNPKTAECGFIGNTDQSAIVSQFSFHLLPGACHEALIRLVSTLANSCYSSWKGEGQV